MSATTVVNLKGHRDEPDFADVLYVGRAVHRGGWHLPASPLASPFRPVRTAAARTSSSGTANTCWAATTWWHCSRNSAGAGSAAGARRSRATPQ